MPSRAIFSERGKYCPFGVVDWTADIIIQEMLIQSDEIEIVHEHNNIANLETFTPATILNPNQTIYSLKVTEFIDKTNNVYEKIIQWRKNLFKLPTGKSGKDFISELTFWLETFNSQENLNCIAMKVFMILPALLLQKPSKNSKSKDHSERLEKRLKLWKTGNFEDLLREGQEIQKRLLASKQKHNKDKAKVFSNLMLQGKVTAALKMLSQEEIGVHEVNEQVIRDLKEKHPDAQEIPSETLYQGPINKVLPTYFDEIDEEMVLRAITRTKGAGGPSHMDAELYRHILTSKKFKKENKELRNQIAKFAKLLATKCVDPHTLESYVACRLIPLDKNPGVRPIGVGEILRRVVGKCIGWVLKDDIQDCAGPLQVATGLQSGAEAAIHAMREIFENNETDAVILVDASNAFNSLNRNAALHNVRILCPQFSYILTNTYRIPVRMIIYDSKDIMSVEGTTQGDNLAMSFYAIGIAPIIENLKRTIPSVKNVALADDITGAGKFIELKLWWEKMITEGKKYGYYVNESKSWMIVKDSDQLEDAKLIFQDSAINFTAEGKRHLGAAIGSEDFREQYSKEKVKIWCEEMERLSEYAKTQPHAAYSAFCHGEIHKYTYFMRTIPNMRNSIEPLDNIITQKFIPNLLNSVVTEQERQLFSLPIRKGGIGIPILSETCDTQFENSISISSPLKSIIVDQLDTLPDVQLVNDIKNEKQRQKEKDLNEKVKQVDENLSPQMKKAVEDTRLPGVSSWLSVLPLSDYGFALNKGEFRDALLLRYGKDLRGLPSHCPCGQKFDVNHALNCKKGGFVIIRHNSIRDFEADLLSEAHRDIETEPALQPVEGELIDGLAGENARPDIRARGVWRPGQNAFFDVRVTNTNSKYQVETSTMKCLEKHEKEKKRQYNNRIMNIEHGTFTPLVFSITGVMGKECSRFHKHMADKISKKNEEKYSDVVNVIKCKLSFLILRASLLCIRGSRTHKKDTKVTDDFSTVFLNANMQG